MSDEQEALEALIEELLNLGATDLVRDVHAAIARGTTRHGDDKKREKVAFQAAFTAREAFVVAIRHVVAAIDPLFMIHESRALLGRFGESSDIVEVMWAFDRLQGPEDASVLFPSADEYIEPILRLPEVEPQEFTAIRENVVRLRHLCNQMFEGEV